METFLLKESQVFFFDIPWGLWFCCKFEGFRNHVHRVGVLYRKTLIRSSDVNVESKLVKCSYACIITNNNIKIKHTLINTNFWNAKLYKSWNDIVEIHDFYDTMKQYSKKKRENLHLIETIHSWNQRPSFSFPNQHCVNRSSISMQ